MRPTFVVVDPPFLDDIARFGERCKHVVVKALVARLPVEAFDEGILRGLTLRDLVKLYAMLRRPRKHRQARQLGAVVHHDRLGQATLVGDPV